MVVYGRQDFLRSLLDVKMVVRGWSTVAVQSYLHTCSYVGGVILYPVSGRPQI